MKFNVNEYVRVKLTDVGRRIHRENWDAIAFPPGYKYEPPSEDKNGWSKWQLWCLMQEFGSHMSNGCRVPFETEIDIIDPNPKRKAAA